MCSRTLDGNAVPGNIVLGYAACLRVRPARSLFSSSIRAKSSPMSIASNRVQADVGVTSTGGAAEAPELPTGVEEFETSLEVQFTIPELGLVYADDDEANRYIIDRTSASPDEVAFHAGQRLSALVTTEGHVQRVLALTA